MRLIIRYAPCYGSGLAVLNPSVHSAALRGGCLRCVDCAVCLQLK